MLDLVKKIEHGAIVFNTAKAYKCINKHRKSNINYYVFLKLLSRLCVDR